MHRRMPCSWPVAFALSLVFWAEPKNDAPYQALHHDNVRLHMSTSADIRELPGLFLGMPMHYMVCRPLVSVGPFLVKIPHACQPYGSLHPSWASNSKSRISQMQLNQKNAVTPCRA